jgi:hypothetical protein
LESDFYNATTRFFTPKIDDHGVRRGDTGQILAQWRRPVASSEALDVLYWAMHPASYRRIRMAIETAHEVGAFFSIVDFLSYITVAKRPSYGQLNIKPSYTIVLYDVLM